MKVNPRARQFARRRPREPTRSPPGPVNFDAAVRVPRPAPWRCTTVMCLTKPGWWISKHGVINCLNCCPPQSPDLVVAQGTDADAPIVTIDQSRIPIDWMPPRDLAPVKPVKKPRKSPKRVAP